MQAHYQIKLADVSHISTIQQIAHKAWWKAYPSIISNDQISFMIEQMYSVSSLAEQMDKLQHKFALVHEDEQILGFVSYCPHPKNAERMRLEKLYLLPNFKGMGLGKILVHYVCQEALHRGLKIIELNVNRANPALKFYQRMGFEIESEVDLPFGPYWLNDYVMVKKLVQI